MRTLTCWLAGTALLATLGCSGGGSNPAAPGAPSGTSTPIPVAAMSASGALGSPVLNGDITTSALAIYTLEIDRVSLQATASLKETRSGQANDDLYLLPIDSFLRADSFKVTGITGTTDTVDVTYQIEHPFPAPNNPTGTPNGSTNRADLGIAGMALFLTDVASATGNTYFTDRVANTETVANADAYYAPGGLLTVSGTANTFPYKQLVDELAGGTGSRVGQSNAGDVTGNFGIDGWTRSEFGGTNDGWTGYGVLHQGQASSNTLSLNKAALSSGFSLDVAVIAKYNDPRGGTTGAQKKANRLPPASADASLFAYRMPHGALDGAQVIVEAESGGFAPNTISGSTLNFHVVDWDARATETAAADLSEDTSFTTVAVGESGTPTLDVCIPGVLGDATFTADASTVVDDDSAFGGDAGADGGNPGDALFYSTLVTKVAGSGQTDGDYTGMVRVTDPESGLLIGLDEALTPLGTPPDPITYQSFTVTMINPCTAPSGGVVSPSGTVGCAGFPVTFGVSFTGDPAITYTWDFGGGATPNSSSASDPLVTLGAANTYNGSVTIDNGCGSPVNFPFSYTVQAAFNEHLVDDNATGNSGFYPMVTIHNGNPVIVSGQASDALFVSNLRVSMATTPTPSAPGDWVTHTAASVTGTAANAVYFLPTVTSSGGRLVIVWRNNTTAASADMFCTAANVATPTSAADYTTYLVSAATGVGVPSPGNLHTQMYPLINHNGGIAFIYRDGTNASLNLAYSSVAVPTVAGAWAHSFIEDTASSLAFWADGLSYNDGSGDRLAVIYRDSTNGDPRFTRSTVAVPTGPAGWLAPFLFPTANNAGQYTGIHMATIGGQPRMVCAWYDATLPGGLLVTRATVLNPSSAADFVTPINFPIVATSNLTTTNQHGLDIESVDGRIFIAYSNPTAIVAGCVVNARVDGLRATTETFTTAADFMAIPIDYQQTVTTGYGTCNTGPYVGLATRPFMVGANPFVLTRDGNGWLGAAGFAAEVLRPNCTLP